MKPELFTVVCVDDEDYMLKAVNRMVRRLRPDWSTCLTTIAKDWPNCIDDKAPTIFISDLLMPGITGESILKDVRNKYPQTIRVLLTGDTKPETKQSAFDYAHFVIPKPFESQDFEHVFNCTEQLHQLPFDDNCKIQLGKLCALPVLPESVKRLRQSIASQINDTDEIAKVIENEPVLIAKLFQVANSSYMGFRQPTDQLSKAINRLGESLIETLAISLLCEFSDAKQQRNHQRAVQKAMKTGAIAKNLAKALAFSREEQDKVFTAAMLSSIGAIIQNSSPDVPRKHNVDSNYQDNFSDQHVIAAYILTLWGLTGEICTIVLHQDDDDSINSSKTQLAGVLNMANRLALCTSEQDISDILDNCAPHWASYVTLLLPSILPSANPF